MGFIKKIKKNENGSITMLVLASMLFMLVVITACYMTISNKSINQDKKLSKIESQYSVTYDEMSNKYNVVMNNSNAENNNSNEEDNNSNGDVKVGDYVAYNPTVADQGGTAVESAKLTYTSPTGSGTVSGNGNGDQTFTATSNTKWRVLNIEEDGTVELISEDVVKTDAGSNFILKGAVGYLYAERELNEVCKIYGYGYGADTSKGVSYTTGGPLDTLATGKIEGTGARSITIEDINKKADITEAGYTTLNSNYGSTTNPTSNVFYPTVSTSTGKSASAGVKEQTNTYYSYYAENYITDGDIIDILFERKEYLIASRCINTEESYCRFAVFRVGTNNEQDVLGAFAVCTGTTGELSESGSIDSSSVRPIVTLKYDAIDINDCSKDDEGNVVWDLREDLQ